MPDQDCIMISSVFKSCMIWINVSSTRTCSACWPCGAICPVPGGCAKETRSSSFSSSSPLRAETTRGPRQQWRPSSQPVSLDEKDSKRRATTRSTFCVRALSTFLWVAHCSRLWQAPLTSRWELIRSIAGMRPKMLSTREQGTGQDQSRAFYLACFSKLRRLEAYSKSWMVPRTRMLKDSGMHQANFVL